MSVYTSPIRYSRASTRIDSGRWARRKRMWSNVRSAALALVLVLLIQWLQGCGSGSSTAIPVSEPTVVPTTQESGEVVITITDAEGDFKTYTVDVQSIKLERTNGNLIETVPLTTRIDFTELTELSELFTIATVPAGSYRSVVMRLDY